MKLTKLGVSVALISFIGYVLGYFNIVAVIVLLGIVLIADLDVEAKQNVAQATVLALFFMILQGILGSLSSGYIELLGYFGNKMSYDVYNVLTKLDLALWVNRLVGLLKFGLLIYTIIVSFKGTVVKIPLVSGLVAKNMGQQKQA
ncbi:MAG: hypothetical protein IJ648_02245 [Lachnospiraceae bacterium]|nr:hypothetical protein [Lachnospiraceae bacterium]